MVTSNIYFNGMYENKVARNLVEDGKFLLLWKIYHFYGVFYRYVFLVMTLNPVFWQLVWSMLVLCLKAKYCSKSVKSTILRILGGLKILVLFGDSNFEIKCSKF